MITFFLYAKNHWIKMLSEKKKTMLLLSCCWWGRLYIYSIIANKSMVIWTDKKLCVWSLWHGFVRVDVVVFFVPVSVSCSAEGS